MCTCMTIVIDTTVEFGSTEYTATEESGSIAIEIVRSFHLRGTTVTVEITPYEQSPPSAQGTNCRIIWKQSLQLITILE